MPSTTEFCPSPATKTTSETFPFADSVIVSPKTLWGQAVRFQAAIDEHLGIDIPVLEEGESASQAHRIALGNLANNALIERLYLRRQCFVDAVYPGPGGYVLRALKAPIRNGQDILIVGGDDQGVAAAIDGLLPILGTGVPANLQRLQVDNDEIRHLFRLSRSLSVDALLSGMANDAKLACHQAVELGLLFALTGESECLRKFMGYFRQYFRRCFDQQSCPGAMVYSWVWKFVIVWNVVRDHAAIHDDERAHVDRMLAFVLGWLNDESGHYLRQPENEIRQNHATYHGLSVYLVSEFLQRRLQHEPCSKTAVAVEALFAGQLRSYKINDEAAGYAWQVPRHLLLWSLHQNRRAFLEAGHARRLLDFSVMVADNIGGVSCFGDCVSYQSNADLWRRLISGLVHWHERSSDTAWILAHDSAKPAVHVRISELRPRVLEELSWFNGRYAVTAQTTSSSLPDAYTGVIALLLDQPPLDWVRCYHGEAQTRSTAEQYVDKIAFRREMTPSSEYLLLEGPSTFTHGHQDGNCIAALTWNERLWLTDVDYLRGMPERHSGLTVIRDGRTANPPPFTRLQGKDDGPEFAWTHTVVADYNGGDWHRQILWQKRAFFLVIDRFEPHQAGQYRVELNWQVLGETVVHERRLQSHQAGRDFLMVMAGSGQVSCWPDPVDAPGRKGHIDDYPYADSTISVFNQSSTSDGDGPVRFVTLLTPDTDAQLAEDGEGTVVWHNGQRFEITFHGGTGASNQLLATEPKVSVTSAQRLPSVPEQTIGPAAIVPAPLHAGACTALQSNGDVIVAGFDDGCVGKLCGEQLLPIDRCRGAVTALTIGGPLSSTWLAAGTELGEAVVFDEQFKTLVRVPVADAPIMSVAFASTRAGWLLVVGAADGQLHCFDMNEEKLWSKGVSHGPSTQLGCVDLDGDGNDEIIAGCNYHSSGVVLAADGLRLAHPWFSRGGPPHRGMDSTYQCMTALAFWENADGVDVIWGTLGHRILLMPDRRDEDRWLATWRSGRPLADGRVAGAVLDLRARAGRLTAVDAAGGVSHFDRDMVRVSHHDLGRRLRAARLTPTGHVLGQGEDGTFVSSVDNNVAVKGQVSEIAYLGCHAFIGTDVGVWRCPIGG